jgi:hypothetical protein
MIPTVAVTVTAFDQNGNPVSGGRVQAELDRTEIYNGFIAPECIEGVTDADGVCVLQLWPNALGSKGSSYHVRAYNPDTGLKYLNTTAVVPNNACRLEQIIVAQPFPPIDASGQALIAVQAVLGLATSERVQADEAAAAATAAQQGAVAAAADALASQGIAQTSANTAATQAGVSTTQAEIATNAVNTADAITADALTAAAAAAASVLALKQGAESASTASGVSATASNAAKELSEAAKVISTEEAGKAFVSAGESAASATDAAASSALITNKAEVNIVTAGNVLRADGTLFKSISEVEFLRNRSIFEKSVLNSFGPSPSIRFFDAFQRTNADLLLSDCGINYEQISGTNQISKNGSLQSYLGGSGILGLVPSSVLPNANQSSRVASFSAKMTLAAAGGSGSAFQGIYIWVDANNWYFFGLSGGENNQIVRNLAGVQTIVLNNSGSNLSRANQEIELIFSSQTKRINYINRTRNLIFTDINLSDILTGSNLSSANYIGITSGGWAVLNFSITASVF